MGFEPFLLTSALSLIVAQRLLRKLCARCKQPIEIELEELLSLGVTPEEAPAFRCYQARGCEDCVETGYLGRIAIYEILNVTDQLRHYMIHADDGGRGGEAALQRGRHAGAIVARGGNDAGVLARDQHPVGDERSQADGRQAVHSRAVSAKKGRFVNDFWGQTPVHALGVRPRFSGV